MKNDEDIFKARLLDLDYSASHNAIVRFSDFLNMNELGILDCIQAQFISSLQLFGGNHLCERQMAAFLPDAHSFLPEFPIDCVEIQAKNAKFAEEFNHRDILGSIMNLGFERKLIGDIMINKGEYYFFCNQKITAYICESLMKIKNTRVCLKTVSPDKVKKTISYQEYCKNIASLRLDCVVSALADISRSQAAKLIEGEKVGINSRIGIHNTTLCKQGDKIAVRGVGKFILDDHSQISKKGKIKLNFRKYK